MSDPFADERLQFFLRNREDIKAWSAIEPDVTAATRELLSRSQPLIEESLLAIDPSVLVGRHDSGPWERILARHEQWPESVGLTLEWHRAVDPSGSTPPKLGVFWWAATDDLIAPRVRFIETADRAPLQQLGYKVPLEGIWPVGARVVAKSDWWRDPAGWIATIVERIPATWNLVAGGIDDVLAGKAPVSDG